MRQTRLLISLFFVVLIGAVASCGGSGEQNAGAGKKPAGLPVGDAPYAALIDASGFQVTLLKRFPAQVPGRKGSTVVYREKSGKARGGVIYTNRFGEGEDQMVWHWYFNDAAPDSIAALELNDDGLWDVRIYLSGGKTVDLLQDVDFTFVARPREDLIATNGVASEPRDLWRVFDGDSTSAWRDEDASRGAYVEVYVPLGVRDGILTVQLTRSDRPGKMKVKVDGKERKSFDLEKTTGRQLFQLGEIIGEGAAVRLEFTPSADGTVAVSEISIR